MVTGFWATLGLGLVGGVIGELIRIAGLLRQSQRPGGLEMLGSAIYAALGSGAVLFGWDTPHPILQLVVLGAAFPSIFSNLVASAAVTPPKVRPLVAGNRFRSWMTGT